MTCRNRPQRSSEQTPSASAPTRPTHSTVTLPCARTAGCGRRSASRSTAGRHDGTQNGSRSPRPHGEWRPDRYPELGETGVDDRSSRAHSRPRHTPTRATRTPGRTTPRPEPHAQQTTPHPDPSRADARPRHTPTRVERRVLKVRAILRRDPAGSASPSASPHPPTRHRGWLGWTAPWAIRCAATSAGSPKLGTRSSGGYGHHHSRPHGAAAATGPTPSTTTPGSPAPGSPGRVLDTLPALRPRREHRCPHVDRPRVPATTPAWDPILSTSGNDEPMHPPLPTPHQGPLRANGPLPGSAAPRPTAEPLPGRPHRRP